MTDTKRYWFGPKRIGFGVSPRSWQGWLVLAVYVLVVAALGLLRPPDTNGVAFWSSVAGITLVVAVIAGITYGPRKSG